MNWLQSSLAAAAIVSTAAVAFTLVRTYNDEAPASAATTPGADSATTGAEPWPPDHPPAGATMPPPDVTPPPGATPDITQPYWAVPWLNADRMKPAFDGTLAGIRIGNGVSPPPRACAKPSAGTVDQAEGTGVDVTPAWLPSGTQLSSGSSNWCAGELRSAEATFGVPADEGERRFGGSVDIFRSVREPYASVTIAADRWREARVAGLTVALAEPILPEFGTGSSAVIAYDDGILTQIVASNIELEDLLQIAEAVLQ